MTLQRRWYHTVKDIRRSWSSLYHKGLHNWDSCLHSIVPVLRWQSVTLPDYGPAAKVCPLVAALSHAICRTALGRRGYMGLYFIPSCLSEHGFSYNRYIVQSPTGLSPANRRMYKPEEGEVEGKGHGCRLLVDTPVLVQSPVLEPPWKDSILCSSL